MPNKILVIRLSSLGDVVLTAPVFHSIKAAWSDSSISLLTKKEYAPALEGERGIDEIIPFEGLRQTLTLIRQQNFTHLLDLHANLRSFLIRRLSGIAHISIYRKHALERRLFVMFRRRSPDLEKKSVERYLDALAPWNIPPARNFLKLTPDPGSVAAMGKALEQAGIKISDIVVGVHPGAKWPTKRWLAERFAELCRRFETQTIKVVLVGSTNDAELCAYIAQQNKSINMAGKTDLPQLKALVSRFSLFITNDSGPMHLAAACGVPTLALFGPTSKELGFFPYGLGHRVLESELACRPCSLHGENSCPHGHFLCMKLMTTDTVWQNAMEMLKR